jgi:hypothetical protein
MKSAVYSVCAGLALVAVACEDGDDFEPNRPPTVEITGGAADGEETHYRVEFSWIGRDRDGVVDHYLYAIDDTCLCRGERTVEVDAAGRRVRVPEPISAMTPEACARLGIAPRHASADSIWRRTDATSGRFVFSATTPDSSDAARSTDWHTFFIKAVDDAGARSRADSRFFNATTIAPTATITAPPPAADFATVPPYVRVRWQGEDEDGPDKRPAGYQLKLIEVGRFDPEWLIRLWLIQPEMLRRNLLIPDDQIVSEPDEVTEATYLATDWYPKATAPHDAPEWELNDLGGGAYAVAVRAVDEAGAIMPDEALRLAQSDRAGNVLKLDVNPSAEILPHLLVTEEMTGYSKLSTSYDQESRIQAIANVPLRFRWTMDAAWYGGEPGLSSWAVDIPDPDCEVCQDPEGRGGWIPWARYTGLGRDITFTEEEAGEVHTLYIRARDASFDPEREIRVLITMEVVVFPFDKAALWIDDFVAPRQMPNDCDHEALIGPMLAEAIEPYLGPDEELEQWQSHRAGAGGCTELVSLPLEMTLSRLSRYRLLYWNVSDPGFGSALGQATDPGALSEGGRYLKLYVWAGGNLIVWGRKTIGAMLGDQYPDGPYNPDLPGFEGPPSIYPGTFLWDVLRFRTQFDRPRRGDPALDPRCSGLIALEATDEARVNGFPVGIADPTGYDPTKVAIWWDEWQGAENPYGLAGVDAMTGDPPLHVPLMDTLYTFVSNSWSYVRSGNVAEACGTDELSPLDGQPVIVRYAGEPDAAWYGSRLPCPPGRVVWIGTPLYVFAGGHYADIKLLMRKLTDWIIDR